MKRVTGIGGIFFKAADPAALSEWYRVHLGLPMQDWGGAVFVQEAGASTIWSAFPADTDHFAPSSAPYMLNYRVADLAALFQKTELQRLLRERQAGRVRWLRLAEPALAGGNNGWDLRLTVAWSSYEDMLKDAAGAAERQSRASIEDMLRADLVEEQSEVLIRETVPQQPG